MEEQVKFMMAYERKKCSALLFFGAISGSLGFAFAFIIGVCKFLSPSLSEFHQQFPSGYGYFPATVSEMVHDPTDPAGKVFFAFEFIAALFIFMAWYPWELRNVYTGDSATVPGFHELSWPMWRQFVPSAGMMLVATVTTTPFAQANALDYICISIHLTGAVMLFAGYAMVEVYTVGWGPFKQSPVTAKVIGDKEKFLRKFLLNGIIFFYFTFIIFTFVILLPLPANLNDVWEPRMVEIYSGVVVKEIILTDTASGFVLFLKIASYVSEVACGLFLISSFMVIWYFCEERHVDLVDELCKVT